MSPIYDLSGTSQEADGTVRSFTGTITLADIVVAPPSTSNLIQQPNNFSVAPWVKSAATATFVSANGATKVIEDTTLTWHYVSQNIAQSGSKTYLFSAKVKSLGRGVALQLAGLSGEVSATFNLTGAGAFKTSSGSGTGVTLNGKTITPADASGYHTVSINATVANASPSIHAALLVGVDSGTRFQGGGTLGFEAKNLSLTVV